MDMCYHFMHLLYEEYIKKYNDVFFNGFKFNKWQNLIYKDQNYFSNILGLKNKINIATIRINAHDVHSDIGH